MQLSQHFTLSELTKSSTATRLGINNSLDPELDVRIVKNLVTLAENILEPIRAYYQFPFTPNSGYRCMDLELVLCRRAIDRFIVRGYGTQFDYLTTKSHPTGHAVDIEIPGIPNLELAEWIRDNLDFDQLILEFYKRDDPTAGWVHVSYRDDNRNEVLTIGSGNTIIGLPSNPHPKDAD